jgi:hypothetical protein
MIPPNARSKTTIGTATATARVVVETPLLRFPALEAAEVFEDAPVVVSEFCPLLSSLAWPSDDPVFVGLLEDALVEVPEACSLLWLLDVPVVTTDCQKRSSSYGHSKKTHKSDSSALSPHRPQDTSPQQPARHR